MHGRDLADTLLRVAVVEDLRLLVEVVRDHDVRVAELRGAIDVDALGVLAREVAR